MGFISKLFGTKKESYEDKPPVYGGDGLSANSPAIINCASMEMARSLMDDFISKKCGKGWKKSIEFTLEAPNDPEKLLSSTVVHQSSGNEINFYFDLSRPVGNAMKKLGL